MKMKMMKNKKKMKMRKKQKTKGPNTKRIKTQSNRSSAVMVVQKKKPNAMPQQIQVAHAGIIPMV